MLQRLEKIIKMKYELIIKEIESGEVVCRKECDCVVGAVAGIDGEEVVASTISHVEATVLACFGALAAAQDACDNLEDHLYEDFKEFLKVDAPKGLFREFIESLREKGKVDSVTISVDEDALRAVANGEVEGV